MNASTDGLRDRSLKPFALGVLVVLASASAGPSSALAKDDPAQARKEAIELFQKSRALYKDGRYGDAVDLLRRAYRLDPSPILLYNLARALELDGDLEEAILTYEEYLDESSDLRDRGAIEARLDGLRVRLRPPEKADRRSPSLTLAPVPASPHLVDPGLAATSAWSGDDRAQRLLPWIPIGVGGASLTTGAVLGLLAWTQHRAAIDAPTQVSAIDDEHRAHSLGMAANVTLIGGAVLATAGVIWGLAEFESEPSTAREMGLAGR